MQTTDSQKIEEAQAAFVAAQTKQQTQAGLLCLLAVFVVLVLPRFVPPPFSGIVMVVGAAGAFTTCFSLYQQSLRTRNGSQVLAYGLLAFMWLCAVVMTLLSLTGRIG